MFNPWVTQHIAEQLPEIKLTVDFSHWCVVCERLMDTELDVIKFIANNTQHIHAHVGYDQRPQVPDPCASEFGPNGYMHEMPFSKQPVADLWEINCWMAQEKLKHFT